MGDELTKIREAVIEGRYVVSEHAFEELADDRLHLIDLESAILTGEIVRVQPFEPRRPGPRYTVQGKAADLSTVVRVICRFIEESNVLIITVYVPSHD